MSDAWLNDALARATAAAAGRLIEGIHAYTDRSTEHSVTVARSELSAGNIKIHPSKGERNVVFCGYASRFSGQAGLRVRIDGSDNIIFIGPYAAVGGMDIDIKGSGNTFYFGAFSSSGNMVADLHQGLTTNIRSGGGQVFIGDHCMIATRVVMGNSDGHSIYSTETGMRLNMDRDIFIDDHVWVGRDVRLNKGVRIGRDTIVGQGSIVSGKLDAACIYNGAPALKRREGVTWSRMPSDSLTEMEASPRHRGFLRKIEHLKQRIILLDEKSDDLGQDHGHGLRPAEPMPVMQSVDE